MSPRGALLTAAAVVLLATAAWLVGRAVGPSWRAVPPAAAPGADARRADVPGAPPGGAGGVAADGGSVAAGTAGQGAFAPASAAIDVALLTELLAELPTERDVGSAGHRRTREWLLERARGWGLEPRLLPFTWPALPRAELASVELRLPGAADGRVVIACAHFDAVVRSPGADDNGSGVVALLAVARALAARDPELQDEVRLLFLDAEEPGLLGALAYVRALSPAERGRIEGVINLESVGYYDPAPGTQRMPPGVDVVFDPGDRADFLLLLANVESSGFARALEGALRIGVRGAGAPRIETFTYLPGDGFVLPDSRRSDHAPFWDVDVPAVMLTDTADFRNPHYHRPGDRVATLDLRALAAVARGVETALLALAGE